MGTEIGLETGGAGDPSAALAPLTDGDTEEIEGAVQITVMIELDPVPAVTHLAHVLPEDTEGETRLPCPAARRDPLRRDTVAEGALLYPGQGLDRWPAPIPARVLASLGPADGEDLHLTIQELIEKKHALMLARAVNPATMTAV